MIDPIKRESLFTRWLRSRSLFIPLSMKRGHHWHFSAFVLKCVHLHENDDGEKQIPKTFIPNVSFHSIFHQEKSRLNSFFLMKVNQNFNKFQIGCYRLESNIYLRINQIMKICVLLNQINIVEDESVKTNNKNLNQVRTVIIDASKLLNYK